MLQEVVLRDHTRIDISGRNKEPSSLPLSFQKFRLTNFHRIFTFPISNRQSAIINPQGGGLDISLALGKRPGVRGNFGDRIVEGLRNKCLFSTTFPQTPYAAKRLFLAGDFNNWDVNNLPMKKDNKGTREANLALQAGRYGYRFRVDEVWLDDPNAQETVENPFGSQNCVRMMS